MDEAASEQIYLLKDLDKSKEIICGRALLKPKKKAASLFFSASHAKFKIHS